jgi:hypothetical protein
MDIQNVSAFDELALPPQRSLFRCPAGGDMCNGSNKTAPENKSVEIVRRHLKQDAQFVNGQCTEGHVGVLCGVCDDGWTGSFNKLCTACPESTESGIVLPAIILVVGIVVAALVYKTCAPKFQNMQQQLDERRKDYALMQRAYQRASQMRGELRDSTITADHTAFQALREQILIVIGNLQIIMLLPLTTKFHCQACDQFMDMLNLDVLQLLNFDILSFLSLECAADVSLYLRLCVTIALPAVLIALVQGRARIKISCSCSARVKPESIAHSKWVRSIKAVTKPTMAQVVETAVAKKKASQPLTNANQLSLLIVFLAYPTWSRTIFSIFACRKLDAEEVIHVYDHNIDCLSTVYIVVRVLAILLVIVILVGIPLGFAVLLYKNRTKLNPSNADSVPFKEFKLTVKNILGQDIGERKLRRLFDRIDTDNSDAISTIEVWAYAIRGEALNNRLRPQILSKVSSSTDSMSGTHTCNDGTPLPQDGPEEFKLNFLCKSYTPRYYWFESLLAIPTPRNCFWGPRNIPC